MDADTAEKLAELDARLKALEQGGVRPQDTQEVFWILEGLKARTFDGVVFAGQVSLPGGSEAHWQYGLSTPVLLAQPWEAAAPMLAALGHPARLSMLRAVLSGRGRNTELAELGELGSTGQLYHHLRELVAAGWLAPAGRGAHRVPADRVVPLLAILSATHTLDASPNSAHEPETTSLGPTPEALP